LLFFEIRGKMRVTSKTRDVSKAKRRKGGSS